LNKILHVLITKKIKNTPCTMLKTQKWLRDMRAGLEKICVKDEEVLEVEELQLNSMVYRARLFFDEKCKIRTVLRKNFYI